MRQALLSMLSIQKALGPSLLHQASSLGPDQGSTAPPGDAQAAPTDAPEATHPPLLAYTVTTLVRLGTVAVAFLCSPATRDEQAAEAMTLDVTSIATTRDAALSCLLGSQRRCLSSHQCFGISIHRGRMAGARSAGFDT